ncbi:hypothetical protein ACWKSP_31135 [Micromonosporaceae bacterium Da 78-11]
MTGTAIEFRRWVGKLVLFLAGAWAVVLVAAVSGLIQGATIPALSVVAILIPGCAFVPAAYYAIKLQRVGEPEQVNDAWRKSLRYGIAGAVLLIVAVASLYQAGKS